MDSSKNQEEVNKEQDLNRSKDNLVPELPTLDKTPEPSSRESLLLPIKSSSSLTKRKPHYKIVPTEKAKPKKKINGNIGEQNVVIEKRIKKQL